MSGRLRMRLVLLLVGALLGASSAWADEHRILRVVGDQNYPPFLFRGPAGDATGYLVDWWALWSRKTGIEVDLRVEPWSEAQAILLRGDADVIDTIFRTPEREPRYDFTAPYARLPVNIYVHASISGIRDLAGLHGFLVGVMAGDACIEALRSAGVGSLLEFPDYTTLVERALDDEVRVFCLDEMPANFYLTRKRGHTAFRKAFQLYEGRFHRGVRKGDVDTLRLIERGAAAISAAEEAALREKWLPPPPIDHGPRLRALAFGIALVALVAVILAIALRAARLRVRRQTAVLQAGQARLSSLFQALPDLVWFKDPEGTFVACNTALERALGAPPDGVVGKRNADFFSAAKAAEFLAQDHAAMAAAGPLRAEAWASLPGVGEPRLYQTTRQRVLDANGQVLGTVGITRDITEHFLTEEALQERVKELRCLYAVFKATEKIDRPLPDVLRAVAAELVAGFRYPEIAVVRLEIGDLCEASGCLEDAVTALDVDIPAETGPQGRVSVGYLEPRPPQGSRPFDTEEQRLFEAVAERLGSALQARAAAAQYERARRFAHQVIDTANVMVLGLDKQGRVLFLNAAGQALTGYTAAELIGQDWFALLLRFEADDIDSRAEFARTVATGAGLATGENTLWTKDGVGRRILWSYNTVLNPEGEQIAVAFGMDVTEQRRTEAALVEHQQHLETLVAARTAELEAASASLRASNEEQQAIFDASDAGIVLLRERIISRCNRTMEAMLGYGPGELLGCTSRIWLADEETFQVVGQRIEQSFAADEAYRDEVEVVRKDGSRFWGRLHAAPIDPADLSKGVAGMIRDITPERAAVEEIKRARAVAEEAARAKSDFLANMSHEIRTPMNAIIGMAHLALRTALTPRQRDYLAKIQGASEHLLGIINDILDFSKSEAGKLELEQAEFELEKMLVNVATLLSERSAAKDLEFVLDVAPDVPQMLVGDELRIRQVLLNFCSNAVKFTERGEVAVVVRLLERAERDALLEFAVRDTGIGISEAQQARLFQSFQQADTSTSRRYGGTGLGLVISKRLIDLMHGEIGVDTAPGEGSTFRFRVRLGIGRTQSPALQPAPDLRGARMLVVDDNGTARTVLKDMLARMGFVVDEAASGAAALDCVRQAALAGRGYAVVFLDWRMPGMDGVETARRIGHLGLAMPPRCVMVTAHGREELMQEMAASGATSVLIKPVAPSLLFDTLMQVLGGPAAQHGDGPLPAIAGDDLSALRGARILLVEDNELNQEVAKAMLEALGLTVDIAGDGEVAVRKVQEASYDLVFMDMQMPVMDGLAATRAIRRLPGTGVVPIVAMTANILQQDRERCFEAGMNDYLGKPIEPALLTAALKRWVKPHGVAAAQGRAGVNGPAGLALEVDGLDVEGALRRVAGNAPFLLSLLRRFVDGNRHAVADIDRLLETGDRAGAERHAHTLKGVAATLGATRLQQAASDLEAALHADPGSAETTRRLATLGAVLVSLCADLDRQLPGAVTAVEADAQPAA